MKVLVLVLLVCISNHGSSSLNLPAPRVYVVTPSPRPPGAGDARAAPFYYHNWMRRMDSPQNFTTTTTTKTPDLIFAEFESGNQMKSIRKLLEREKITSRTTTSTTTSTTPRPIYVPESNNFTYTSPVMSVETKKEETKPVDMTDYFALYNNLYNPNSEAQAPVFMPSTTLSTTKATTTTITTTPSPGPGVENIWHIIDSQKQEQYAGQWEEEPIENEATTTSASQIEDGSNNNDIPQEIDDNFALPGFATNPVNGAENESRAIRTEPNMRFPYINLKPFQVKTQKMPLGNSFSNSKKSNLYTSLDNFQSLNNPTRGEAQDVIMRQPIDRYNPAQPYLPDYGTKSKPSAPASPPKTAVASLVPPPPPPPPKISDGNFPAPSSYESFPPYAPGAPAATPAPAPAPAPTPSISFQPPVDSSDDSGPDSPPSDSDGPPMDLGYRYKPPSAPVQSFVPTYPPAPKPSGYSYDKPKSKPFAGYSYDKPFMVDDSPPPSSDDKPSFGGYDYNKPEAPPSDDHDHHPPGYGPEYPEATYDTPHSDTKPDMDHGPPSDDHGPPSDDHGFPHDFPGDLNYHDFDHHDHDHGHDVYHYHHTTTTTTEMPRVNRYSYYYLGKKLYYLPLYFSVYFIVYVGALIIKAVLRHKIVYPNSWRPNDQTAGFFSKRSVDSWDLSNENLHEITGKVTHAIAEAGKKYFADKKKK